MHNLSIRSAALSALSVLVLASTATFGASAPADETTRRPNVVFILADDLGWMDTGLYGSEYYQTPNIDRLAQRGMMFTNAYAANPLCSPTRASIQSGQYPARLRITKPEGHLKAQTDRPWLPPAARAQLKMITPNVRRHLPLETYTYGEAFRDAGYATAFMGKWHLGMEPYIPDNQGYDVVVGGRHHPGPPGGYFAPWPIDTIPPQPKGTHIDDTLTDEALKYIEKNKDQPFLLNLWFYSVHAPFQGKKELIAKYQKRKDPRGKQNCPTMGAMIETMDHNVGRVITKLDELGLSEKTIVVFFSDNGGNMYSQVDGTTPTNNAPLRAGKGNIHEGGVREPCIVIWPGKVKPGSRSAETISSIDFYPTLLEMTGVANKGGQRFDGVSIVPALTGGKLDGRNVFCHVPHYFPRPGNLPGTSVRQGDWKCIRVYGEGPDRSCAYELYNLADDLGETRNLADRMPEKVKELDALIGQHLQDVDALIPVPNPKYKPAS